MEAIQLRSSRPHSGNLSEHGDLDLGLLWFPWYGSVLPCVSMWLSRRPWSSSENVLFDCALRQWRRGVCRSDCNTTSAGLSVSGKIQREVGAKEDPHPRKPHNVETATKFERTRQASSTEGLVAHVHSSFSLTTSLSFFVTARPR